MPCIVDGDSAVVIITPVFTGEDHYTFSIGQAGIVGGTIPA